jgi:hypothetical protein
VWKLQETFRAWPTAVWEQLQIWYHEYRLSMFNRQTKTDLVTENYMGSSGPPQPQTTSTEDPFRFPGTYRQEKDAILFEFDVPEATAGENPLSQFPEDPPGIVKVSLYIYK